ncbi:hypothetical protein [Gimesia sp.]|uniref:hypothetical protein n=1 Tax=Gimesia sp. TaxID=2024833 RepID=UPI000C5DFDF9|nr:hypothetical protein [Gimesia sp.]MAX35530.1 hypothetical protein [Gimesia sp.]HAH48784.1 hypothetical protein [Planctomycetaceae bacterium]HBL42680.1 hypothetical protein [Planctomycetaceae bacterium]|tara:strand:- start:4945 stop:6201 length:1257 start_codon:yes stop_codon:yes gene_type:complete
MRVATVFFVAFLAIASSRGDDSSPPKLPSDARASLEKNAALFSNVLITGEIHRRPLVPVETVLKKFDTSESEADFTKTLHFELRFQGPLFRESTKHPAGKSYTRDLLHEISFDGTQYRIGYKELKEPASSSISIYTPGIAAEYGKLHDRANSLARMEFWYLRETGFSGPKTLDSLGQAVVSTVLNAADQQKLVSVSEVASGGETFLEVIIEQPEPWQSAETFDIETHQPFVELLNGTDILQMRLERERRQLAGKDRVIRFWLNRAHGYAVEEKWESRKETGETLFHTKNSDFVQVTPDGVWMPKRCVVESHAYYTAPLFISPDPLYETVIQMDQCVPGNFEEDQFRIWYDIPGVEVADWTSPKATLKKAERYTVPASIDDLAGKSSGQWRWLVILNILFIAGWLGWWYSQSRKQQPEA